MVLVHVAAGWGANEPELGAADDGAAVGEGADVLGAGCGEMADEALDAIGDVDDFVALGGLDLLADVGECFHAVSVCGRAGRSSLVNVVLDLRRVGVV